MKEDEHLFKVSEICSQITGKYDNLATGCRRFILQLNAQLITDRSAVPTHEHDRTFFLFNDLLLVCFCINDI